MPFVPTGPSLFDLLPLELLELVFWFLPRRDAIILSQVSNAFLRAAMRWNLSFEVFDLQRCWDEVDDDMLAAIQPWMGRVRALSVSWCSSPAVSLSRISALFLQPCVGLRVLRMASCVLSDELLAAVTVHAPHLQELDLQRVTGVTQAGFGALGHLRRLQRLNLSNTDVSAEALGALLISNEGLTHLSLGHCMAVSHWNTIVTAISLHCPLLISLDLWRARSLTTDALLQVARRCVNLQELDIGWCRDVDSTILVPTLVSQCPGLTKLFLTALRHTTDLTLLAASRATCLQQLDVLGASDINPAAVEAVLQGCKALQLLDVSFCSRIDAATVHRWAARFPAVAIKKSFCS